MNDGGLIPAMDSKVGGKSTKLVNLSSLSPARFPSGNLIISGTLRPES